MWQIKCKDGKKDILYTVYIYKYIYIYRYPSYFGSGVQHLMQNIFISQYWIKRRDTHTRYFFCTLLYVPREEKLAKIKLLQKEKMAKINFCQEKKWQN